MRFMNIWKQERNTTQELDTTKFQDQWISSMCDTTPTFTYFVKQDKTWFNVWKDLDVYEHMKTGVQYYTRAK